MPSQLHSIFTVIKMCIHIDNELSIYEEDPGGGWHGKVATVAGVTVVLDWSFLVWDGVLGPNPVGDLWYLLAILVIVGTVAVLAVLGKVIPSGGGDEALHRHIHWMQCVAGFSAQGAQPLVVFASVAVILNYFMKFPPK